MTLRQRFWRKIVWWQYRLWQQQRHNRLVLETVGQWPLLVLPQVLNPVLFRTGAFFAKSLNAALITPGSRVLDMGTGSGVVAIAASQWASEVVAVDVSKTAVRCAQINLLLNDVADKVTVLLGDLFQPLAAQQFDTILFNPPYFVGEPASNIERAFYASDLITRFAQAARHHLAANGQILLLLASQADEATILQQFRQQGFAINIAAQKDMRFEIVTIYRLH